jgi:hypothetical protein
MQNYREKKKKEEEEEELSDLKKENFLLAL